MIRRIKDYGKKAPSKDAHKVYIVCEGADTEPLYFEFFQNCSSNLQIITIPPTDGTDPLKLMEKAKQELLHEGGKYLLDYQHGDTVWFVIDTDTWEKEGKITPLRTFCREQNAVVGAGFDEIRPYEAWHMAQSNPCFEIWLYYHFYDAKPNDEEIADYSSFKAFVDRSIAGGFNYSIDPARLETAIRNSAALTEYDADIKLMIYGTEVFRLGDEILKFTKRELDKLKNKLG